jgi:hypothetical protein
VEQGESFDLSAAGLRADGADVAVFFGALADKLEQALPGRTSVERRGGGLLGRGPRTARSVQVELGACRYRLELEGGVLRGSRERRSGGIAIGRDALDADAWIEAVTGDLQEEATRDAGARLALERLLA